MMQLDRDTPITVRRRTLMHGAAWTAPIALVAAAAPGAAASPCTSGTVTLNWNNGSSSVAGSVFTFYPANVPGLVVTITATAQGTNLGTDTGEFGIVNTIGGLGVPGLRFNSKGGVGYDNRMDYTIAFSTPVTNLAFTLTDIDSSDKERASLAPAGFTATHGAAVTGTGTSTDPWIGPSTDVNNQTGSAGNVAISYTGSQSSATASLWNPTTSAALGEAIFITLVSFSIPCA